VTVRIDREGVQCGDLQQYREITQNSIEAIKRTGRGGEISWDCELRYGFRKQTCTDNGSGMYSQEQIDYLQNLDVNGADHNQGIRGNFGIGSRISTLYHNRFGVWYESWRDGDSSAIYLYHDGNNYGLKVLDDEEYDIKDYQNAAIHVPLVAPPDFVTQVGSGTKVILMGTSEDHNTTEGPYAGQITVPAQWLEKYLNTRWFRLPSDIQLFVREYRPESFWIKATPQRRRVMGQDFILRRVSRHHNVLELPKSNARAYWYIIREDDEVRDAGELDLGTGTKAYLVSGHTGYIYQEELYEIRARNDGGKLYLGGGVQAQQQCGIFFGGPKVVIYIEPLDPNICTDSYRKRLELEGRELDWGEFADEFKQNMPKELADYIEEQSQDRRKESVDQTQELRKYVGLFDAKSMILSKDGDQTSQPGNDRPKPNPNPKPPGPPKPPKPPDPNKPKRKLRKASDTGEPSTSVASMAVPEVVWPAQDSIENPILAATYVPGRDGRAGIISANEWSPLFNEWASFFLLQYGDEPGHRASIQKGIRVVWEYTLTELVIVHERYTKTYRLWPNTLITPEELTVGLMTRKSLLGELKRAITKEVGFPPPKTLNTTSIKEAPISPPKESDKAAE
jgi:hypothetical protein